MILSDVAEEAHVPSEPACPPPETDQDWWEARHNTAVCCKLIRMKHPGRTSTHLIPMPVQDVRDITAIIRAKEDDAMMYRRQGELPSLEPGFESYLYLMFFYCISQPKTCSSFWSAGKSSSMKRNKSGRSSSKKRRVRSPFWNRSIGRRQSTRRYTTSSGRHA